MGVKGKAKKGPAKPKKSKAAGSLAAASPFTGPFVQQVGLSASSGAVARVSVPPGYPLNPQVSQSNPAGYVPAPQAPQESRTGYAANPQAPQPYPAGYLHNPQAAAPDAVQQHLQTLGRLVSQAETNCLSTAPPFTAPSKRNPPSSNPPNPSFALPKRAAQTQPFASPHNRPNLSLAPPSRALQSPPFSNPQNVPNPSPAPAYRASQLTQFPQNPQYPPSSQRLQGLSMPQALQNQRPSLGLTEHPYAYPRTQTQLTSGLDSGISSGLLGTTAELRSFFPAANSGPGPVPAQETSFAGVAYQQSALQRGLSEQWQQEVPQQGLGFGGPLQSGQAQGWGGPVSANAAAQVERSWRAPENVYETLVGGQSDQPNQPGYARSQDGRQAEQGGCALSGGYTESARWGGLHPSGAGFAAQTAYARGCEQMPRSVNPGSQQYPPASTPQSATASLNPSALSAGMRFSQEVQDQHFAS